MEGINGAIEGLGGVVGGEENEGGSAEGGVLVSHVGRRDDDAVVAATATAQSPVEVGVLRPGCGDELAGGGDDLELERVVGSQTEAGAEAE